MCVYMYMNVYIYTHVCVYICICMYRYICIYKIIESFATNGEHCILLSCRRLIFYCRVLKISHDNQEDMD